jgi:anti-sigma regulatory factor (Ser/Thr protein kinase)
LLALELAAEPDLLTHTRRALRRWLRERGADPTTVMEVTIAVNEACANAIEHAYSPRPETFELVADETGGRVRITIRDRGRWRPPHDRNRGRGLKIIEEAMDELEVRRTAEGTEIVMLRDLIRQ